MNDHIVPVTELCFDGNMGDNWSFFEQKFNIFLEASKLNEETDSLQGSVLLNRVGDRALRIYNNFEWSSDEKKTSCKAILKKFKEYFTPSKNVTYERYLFFTRDKIGLETYDSYVTELRQLASTCEFDTLTDSLIRDRLILGISDVSLKDRLLREQGLTLSRGLEICRAAEVAARQLSVISGANSSQSLEVLEIQKQKKHQSNRNQQPKSAPQYTADPGQSYRNHPQTSGNQKISNNFIKNCYKCGSNHSLNKCPAYGLRCKICNKFNHFAKVCNANSYRNRVHNVNVHQSDTDSDSDFSPDQFFLNNINEKSSEKWYEDCFINNKIIVSFRLDSGADCCVLPYTYFKKLNIQTSELTSSTNKITDYNGKIINTVGSVYLKVRQCKNKENIAKLKFYIVKTHNDAILGLDACIMLNLIQKNNINVINDNLHNDIESISQIIHEYDDAFRGVGCLKGKHTIKIDEKVAPRVHPPRKVPFAMHDKLMKKLKELERLEIIRKVTEPTDWVKATDSGYPPRSSRVEVFIQILDENDNNPSFLPEPSALIIPEDIHVGTEIARVKAADADSGEYGKITYLLDRLSSQGKFTLDGDTGILKVSDKLDREEKPNFLLIIEGWDNYQYGFNSGESRNAFKHINITIEDVNDNVPVLHVPPYCINITEFHEPGQPVTTIHASDADDPETSNGQVIIDIADGNQHNLFELQPINEWSVDIRTTTSLRGRHGNYTLVMRAQDLGIPSLLVEDTLRICVADYNDHPPIFISPPPNSTLKVPENATVGSALIQILASDEDVGQNGAVRYRLKTDPAGHWKFFELQPISGILELRLPLDRKKQKIYDIRIEAYDLGVPTPLSSELDLTVYVSDMNNYQPQFMVDEYYVNFTENVGPEMEIKKLPDTIDRDEFEYEGPSGPVCYYIIGGNENNLFHVNPIDHTLMITAPLDREYQDVYILLIKATEDCTRTPKNQSFFDSDDDTQLKVIVRVLDVNDNAPKFIHRVFTGGVSTATSFGTKFMYVLAEDLDEGKNALVTYYLVGKTQMTLTEGLDNLERPPFLVEKETGAVQLNFDPQRGMKGYFDFMVLANDTGGLIDTARVFIYLLREDQRVRFVLRQHPPELRNRIEMFREMLGNVTGAIVNVDEFRVHANQDGTIDKTRTDLYLHLVDKKDNSILEVDEVLKLVDQNTEKLDHLFKDFNVLDTQPGGTLALKSQLQSAGTTFWLSVSCLFLVLLLMLCLALCINQRQMYHRKLKAATATAYVSADNDIDGRGLGGILSGRVPNTNKHSLEGSNPIWLKAYENEWFKNMDDISQSEHDSLDENVISYEDSLPTTDQTQETQERTQNIYQTLPVPAVRKLETTEL